jgi:transcriptional regulator with XRE-family HTH domain
VPVNGERVRRLRELRVMERAELAELSGISYSTLSQIECNRRAAIRAETARRLAAALDVAPEELVRGLRAAESLRVVS